MIVHLLLAALVAPGGLSTRMHAATSLSPTVEDELVSVGTTLPATYTFNSAVGTLPPELFTASEGHSGSGLATVPALQSTLAASDTPADDSSRNATSSSSSSSRHALLFKPEGDWLLPRKEGVVIASLSIAKPDWLGSNSNSNSKPRLESDIPHLDTSVQQHSLASFRTEPALPAAIEIESKSETEEVLAALRYDHLAKKRSRREAKVSDITDLIEPQYGLIIHVHNVEASSNSSIDTTIMRLKLALSAELPWPVGDIHVEKINFAGSRIAFYLEDMLGRLVPVRDLVTPDLLPRLSARVPDLGLSDVSEEINMSASVRGIKKPFWTNPYFPYVLAGSSVAVVLALSVLIYCCCCVADVKTLKQASDQGVPHRAYDDVDSAENGVVGTHAIFYPALKPELTSPVSIQPDPCAATPAYGPSYSAPYPGTYPSAYTACGPLATPVPTQPIRVKAKGLLERRGSNASLTLDLNQATEVNRWEGTPPKESTALEFLMSAGNRLSRRDLRNAVKHTKILYEEFWEIPMNHAEKVSVAGSGMKNRYKTIIPNEHSRVLLPDIDNDPLNSYINANYIRGYEGEPRAYIATQGPMAHTVMDFWRMIWAEKCPIIVMITKLKEKSKPKCENYLPERWGVFGDVEVVIDSILPKRGYILRHITLRCNGESRTIFHYWYTSWPDHKPPDSPHMLLDLIKEVELRRCSSTDLSPSGPVCVHCSAGIGRTGCFIAISIGIRQLREEHSVDTLGIVCAIRIDRGGMIQTHEQYDFVHQALAVYERELGEPSVQSITALTTDSVTTPP